MHDGVGRIDIGDCDIRPPRQLHAIFPGKIEQRRQHHVRQLDRDAFHPVEGFAARQGFEHVGGSSADQGFKVDEVRGRDDRCHGAALRGMSRRVHPDKTNPLLPLGLIGDLDAAKFRTRRVICVVEFDREDVVITRHRPIRSERRGFAAMHRIVAAELGNTPAICRKSYVHPIIIARYLDDGETIAIKHRGRRTPPVGANQPR